MTGNSLKGSRPILSFDSEFDMLPHLQLLKEIFTSIFGPPANSRRVKPFVDRCMSFSVQDGRIWVRNYQITTNMVKSRQEIKLVEMGPRFTLQIIRIFENSFHGATLYENEFYLSPNNQRRLKMGKQVIKHKKKSKDRMEKALKEELLRLEKDPLDMVFE